MILQDLVGTELPIIQAPMAGVQDSKLAIAVSNAGGLGSLPCAMLSTEGIREELSFIRANTDMPYNVNFFCHQPPEIDVAREQAWRRALAPYYEHYGIDPDDAPPGGSRNPFNVAAADVLEEFKPAVVSFHFGLPTRELLLRVKRWGSLVFSTATTVDEALWLEDQGVDAIIAQGVEAGGHRGMFLSEDIHTQVGLFSLLPQIVREVKVPVVAAGGIADREGVMAAMDLGAAGVQVGTAYMLCPEATTNVLHRTALQSSAAKLTALTNLFTGRPARGIVNRFMRELGPMSALAPAFPFATAAIGPLRKKAEAEGSTDFTPLWCGQNPAGCREVSAAELTRALMQAPTI
ncbi:MAG: nitronate monooxygenase [Pseudohongiellaceae bacterium]